MNRASHGCEVWRSARSVERPPLLSSFGIPIYFRSPKKRASALGDFFRADVYLVDGLQVKAAN